MHGGMQSMPMDYNNIELPFYSEAERTWTTSQDWTLNGVDTLTLYVHGQAREFDIPKAATPPVLDGNMDEAWAKASVQYISTLVDGQGQRPAGLLRQFSSHVRFRVPLPAGRCQR